MLTISRMKSIISPSFQSFSPFIPISGPPTFAFVSKSTPFNSVFTLSLNSFTFNKPLISLPRKGFFSIQTQSKQIGASTPSGEIHVIVGPMFAGKTTTLLRRIQSESSNGRDVAIIKSNKDVRYGLDSIVTHDGVKLPCWALPNLLSFKHKFGQAAYDKLDVIGIDEAQFFEDLYDFCREAADIDGKTVIVAGLDGDYLRRSFGSVLDIIPLADSVTKLTARCEICGHRAFFTLRKTEEKQTELIGGADVYMPVCRQHYVSGQVVIETTRSVVEAQKVQCSTPA